MTGLEAWGIIALLFAVPGYLLWRWRREPSRPEGMSDLREKLGDARNPWVREIGGKDAGPWWNRRR